MSMKKLVCIMLGLLFAFPAAACHKKESPAAQLWCIRPADVAAEEELRRIVRLFDADAHVSFVSETEIDMRLSAAMERGEAPDAFMLHADALPDMAEKKQLLDLSNRLPLSNVQTEKLADAAKRACLYQGKTWAVPLFTDAYMLATNRALVATPPDTVAQLQAEIATLKDNGVSSFAKLTPVKQSILYEALLKTHNGAMLNARRTALTFSSQEGQAALEDCVALLQNAADEPDAIGAGKAAFSVMTSSERRKAAAQYPDAEIELSPLFGYDRLETVAVALSADTPNQKQAFRLLEFLQTHGETIAALYKNYTASKNLQPMLPQDKEAVVRIAQAKPAPDLCGFHTLETTYLPAAIEKAGKGVPAADALKEAADQASTLIWQGKRE